MPKFLSVLSSIAIVLAILTALFLSACQTPPSSYQDSHLIRVVDGDTIVVNRNGSEETVRLIGIDTPESVSPDESKNCKEGDIAKEYVTNLLKPDQPLYLEFDQELQDKYDRTLAYVWLAPPDTNRFAYDCLNAIILQNTYCDILTIPPNTKYEELFLALA